jgi:hypothetical protein
LIVVYPRVRPVTVPLASTVATDASLDDHEMPTGGESGRPEYV